MSTQKCRFVLLVMGPMGWILATVFGLMSCMLAANSRSHDVPWQILGAVVFGPMLASIPVGVTLWAAYRAFGEPTKHQLPAKPSGPEPLKGAVNWHWTALAILGGIETLALPLTFAMATVDDDSLILSIPLNLALITAILLLGCRPYQRSASIVLCVIHLLGISLAGIAAAIEIESVMISGLFLLITGIALTIVGTRPGKARVLLGLSTVAFIVTSFLVIAIGNVGQRAAEAPLFAAIVAFQTLFVPLGLLMLYQLFSQRKLRFRRQFGLKHLFAGMMIVCVASAAAKLAYTFDEDFRVAVAVSMATLIILGMGCAVGVGGWSKSSSKPQPLPETNFA